MEFHTQEPVKHQPPQIKLPEFEEEKKDKDRFVTLVDSRERAEQIEEELQSILKEIDKKSSDLKKKYSTEQFEDKFDLPEDYSNSLSEKEDKNEGSAVDSAQTEESRKAAKNTSSRAAKVAGAYRSVAQMPWLEKQETEKDGENSTADDFAKILGNIERNDGFDEENLPLDPDGVPLSHKTKHVMDALMRNSGVSPSLIYGRRQAAEKNVIIDEDYLEKNGKKSEKK